MYHTFDANAYEKQKPLPNIHLFFLFPHLKKITNVYMCGCFYFLYGQVMSSFRSAFNTHLIHFATIFKCRMGKQVIRINIYPF